MDGFGVAPSATPAPCGSGGRGFDYEDLRPELSCALMGSERTLPLGNRPSLHMSAAEDFEPAASFQWAVLAEEAMTQGHSERAGELIGLAYSLHDLSTLRSP
jgi:hypothetical protein